MTSGKNVQNIKLHFDNFAERIVGRKTLVTNLVQILVENLSTRKKTREETTVVPKKIAS